MGHMQGRRAYEPLVLRQRQSQVSPMQQLFRCISDGCLSQRAVLESWTPNRLLL